MELSFASFVQQVFSSPAMLVTVLLTLGVIFVNGWTDAPNAIAGVVVSGALPFPAAAVLAALCSCAGVLSVTAAVPANTRETVAILTPATRATSFIVDKRPPPFGHTECTVIVLYMP